LRIEDDQAYIPGVFELQAGDFSDESRS